MGTEFDLKIDGLSDFNRVGGGGFADTYSAFEAKHDRTVAVKILHGADDDACRRFEAERATIGQRPSHANIVDLYRAGYTTSDREPYLMMEFVSEGSLEDRIRRFGPIELREAVSLTLPAAKALGFSHVAGVIHNEVKPANVLVSASGVVKLTDFGIAALRSSTTSQVAYVSSYTPPEYFDAYRDAAGQSIDLRDGRSDFYSLAATLFALVTGRPPFSGTRLALMRQIADAPVPATGHMTLDQFLRVATAKDPDRRFRTAEAFMDALRQVPADASA